MEKYITKTTQATPTSNSLRCTIPKEIVDAWLETKFSNNERHKRRIDKITKYEEEF